MFGERLALDLDTMRYDTAESLAAAFADNRDYEEFKMELIRLFSMESPVDQQEFMRIKSEDLSERIYEAASSNYEFKRGLIAEKAYPVIKQVFENQGNVVENIVVPFADGIRQVQVVVNLKKAYESQAYEIVSAFERTISLALIDDAWKEHLREMDELKTSVQNAVYEQKDPLLIYKFESFELFKKMVDAVNKDVLSFLYKGFIATQDAGAVKEARPPQRTDHSKLKTSHDAPPAGGAPSQGGMPQPQQAPRPQAPVRAEPKVGRNDPCPCGSGKKFKSCHGQGAEA